MTRGIVVFLRDGTYQLDGPLTFLEDANTHDSGSNGYTISWAAYPGETPVFSGGIQITGWSLYDASLNIYRAKVYSGLNARSLYVNGLRATRAQGWSGILSKTDTGYLTDNSSYDIAKWKHPEGIEFTAMSVWRFMRCGIDSVSGPALIMKEPCWRSATATPPITFPNFDYPWWIENALELLDAPREWYLDRHAGWLYYKPSPDQDLATAQVIIPAAESLLEVSGAIGTPVHDLQFIGITFEYTNWADSGGPAGYVGIQSGFTWRLAASPIWWSTLTDSLTGSDANDALWTKTPASLVVHYATSILLADNVLTHLGNAALNVEYGSRHTRIVGNLFYDISATGIQVGDNESVFFQTQAGAPGLLTYDTLIRDNLITQTGVEFTDGTGIWAGYVDTLVIDHNEIFNIPYSGVSLGWGWGIFDPTLARNNEISSNDVHDACRGLWDCGSVYMMSAQPGSSIHDNYVHDQPKEHQGALFYLDAGTRDFTITHNVAAHAPDYLPRTDLGLLIEYDASKINNSIRRNYTDASYFGDIHFPGNDIGDNQENLTAWPLEAEQIIESAGLESPWLLLRNTLSLALTQAGTPAVTRITPSALPAGTSATFTITGINTTFVQGTTTLQPIPGVTIGTVTVTSPTTLTVHLAAASNSTLQRYSVFAITGTEQALLWNGLTIQPSPWVDVDLPPLRPGTPAPPAPAR